MSIFMLVVIAAVIGAVLAAGVLGFLLGRQQLPPAGVSADDQLLSKQMERIEALEAELDRVRDQAEFTEKLLGERGSNPTDES
jgi:hypothetical protein